jgi:hypothetical protein
MVNEYFLFFMDNKSGWKTNEKKLSKKDFYHAKYMYKGFKTLSYAPDVVFI